MDRIKYCPHCGGSARLTANYSPKTGLWFIAVACTFCGAKGKYYTQVEDPEEANWITDACINAVSAWNKRYTPAGSNDDDDIHTETDSRRVM